MTTEERQAYYELVRPIKESGLINCYECEGLFKPEEISHWYALSSPDGRYLHPEKGRLWFGYDTTFGRYCQVPVCNTCQAESYAACLAEEKIREEKERQNRIRYRKRSVELLTDGYVKRLIKSSGVPKEMINEYPEIIELYRLHMKTKRIIKNKKL